jgi:hypothetical protein
LRVLQEKKRADELTRTADLISLRVIIQALQGFARGCKSRMYRPLAFLGSALKCTVLRSRWCQNGVRSTWITLSPGAGSRRHRGSRLLDRAPTRARREGNQRSCPGAASPLCSESRFVRVRKRGPRSLRSIVLPIWFSIRKYCHTYSCKQMLSKQIFTRQRIGLWP